MNTQPVLEKLWDFHVGIQYHSDTKYGGVFSMFTFNPDDPYILGVSVVPQW